jgi:hypothetical protein
VKRLTIVTVLLLIATAAPALADGHVAADTLPNGTPIDATIDAPLDGTEIVVPTGEATADVLVSGTASVGNGEADATLVYVIDVSLSVVQPANGDCGGDLNGDGLSNTILDCQLAGVLALNEAAIDTGAVDEVGVAVYGELGAAADMTPGGGDDPITAPDAGPGDVETVVTSVVAPSCDAGVGQFTNKVVGCGFTNFSDGLAAANDIVNASTNSRNVVFFLSDGLSNQGGGTFAANLAALGSTGATVHTFAVGGGSSCLGGVAGTLQEIADDTGGTCTEVISPADLPDTIPDLFSSSLDSLDLSVDGGPASVITDTSLLLPQDGPVAVDYSVLVPGLAPGTHTFCVTAFGSDTVGDGDSGPACVEVNLLQINLTPKTAFNELGSGDDTHTVTATIAGSEGTLEGRVVTFTVTDGPNAGVTGTCGVNADCTTDAAGTVSWTYSGMQGPGGAGWDTIQACFTVADPTGATGCDTAEKEWGDTVPPLSACLPGPNPHGEKIPPAGSSSLPGPKGGQNEDGFYELTASDAVDPAPLIYAVDGGSGFVFGPFADGTVVKWTQAPGATPTEKKMGSDKGQAGAVLWHLRGTGDMMVYAVDAGGNESDPTMCLVPPLPK